MGPESSSPKKKGREWAPRFWEGCNFPAWWRLLVRNSFAVGLPQLYIAVIITCMSSFHTLLRFFEEMFYRDQVAKTRIKDPPLFILGHWRSGTTLLHELLILDPRHSFPTTYQCLEPNHFILTEWLFSRLFFWLLPGRRPMDNMAAGWARPQEEEFALCMLGQPSPYLTIAFPNNPPVDQEFLDFEGVSRKARRQWKAALIAFLQKVTFKNPKRLVLKSPTHTGRIRVLLEMFPDARFIHIVRNPYVIWASTVSLWKSLYRKHGMQTPTFAGLEEHVFATFLRMYKAFDADNGLIDPSRFHEVKYEDLVGDLMGEMRKIYDRLALGGFELIEPRLGEYLERNKTYETNKYDLSAENKAEIERRWGDVIRRYGYEVQ
jgi:omega-hydroxy-beta-dihydromenaquinone-9 sulfotransferase